MKSFVLLLNVLLKGLIRLKSNDLLDKEIVMKTLIKNNLVTLLLLLSTTSVFAEAGAREESSMTLVYLFLAICGLIIGLQLIPVFMMLYGIIKGVFTKKEEEDKPAPVKYR